MVDKDSKALAVQSGRRADEGDALTSTDGAVVHPNFGEPGRSRRRGQKAMEIMRWRGSRTAQGLRGNCQGPAVTRPSGSLAVQAQTAAVRRNGRCDRFVFRLAIFVLSIFVGYYVVWR
jgi:hypothetical protein